MADARAGAPVRVASIPQRSVHGEATPKQITIDGQIRILGPSAKCSVQTCSIGALRISTGALPDVQDRKSKSQNSQNDKRAPNWISRGVLEVDVILPTCDTLLMLDCGIPKLG